MRVCLLQPVLDTYKGANHLPLLGAAEGIEWTIVTNRTNPASPQLPKNVKVETLGSRLGPYYWGFSDYLFAQAVLRAHPPEDAFWQQFDVIHLNQTMGTALAKLQRTGRTLVLLIHHPVSVDRALAMEETTGLTRLLWRLRYAFLIRWQKKLCRTLPHIATVSRTVAQRIETDYGRTAGDIAVIPNGIDSEEFTPGNLAQTDFDVIAVGSLLHPRKGFAYLLSLYKKLAARGLRTADVGRRSEEQQQAMRGIPGLQVFGMVDHDRLLSLMQRSATLVSTSLYEGFGLSLIEALSCGRPAFAFDAGATGEVLRPIDASLIVPLRDVDALETHITTFLSLPVEERVKRGEALREEVLKRYSLKQSAQALHSMYNELAFQSSQ